MELLEQNEKLKQNTVAQACKPSTWEAEAREPGIQLYSLDREQVGD